MGGVIGGGRRVVGHGDEPRDGCAARIGAEYNAALAVAFRRRDTKESITDRGSTDH
ncbi:hypothetical protein ACWGE1_02615 [Streptomyces sp. NPDC054932]